METKLQQAITAQQNVRAPTGVSCCITCLELDMKNKMQTLAYLEAYEQTKLLPTWRILKQVYLAGFTTESLQRYAVQFAKLKQQPMERSILIV